jgi:phage shock protein A
MDRETARMNAERYADPIILSGTPEQQVKELLYAVGTYEQDLTMYRKFEKRVKQEKIVLQARIAELEEKVRQLEAKN